MNEKIVQIKGFTYINGSYVKTPSVSGSNAVIENSSKPRKMNKNAKVNKK